VVDYSDDNPIQIAYFQDSAGNTLSGTKLVQAGWYWEDITDADGIQLPVFYVNASGYYSTVVDSSADWNTYYPYTSPPWPGWAVGLEPIPPAGGGGGGWT
jgi:hypothetical protein